MVHPFSHSLFTPSLFHGDEYDLEALLPADSVAPNGAVILEVDESISTLEEAQASSPEYVMTAEDDSRRAVRYFTSPNTSYESDQISLDAIPNGVVAHQDYNGNLESAIPDNSIEQQLGEVGVEAHMVIPVEMIWLNPASADPGPTVSGLPTRLSSDVLSHLDRDQHGLTSLTFQAEVGSPSHDPVMPPLGFLASSTLAGATESSDPKNEPLTTTANPSDSSNGETDRSPVNIVSPLFI